MRSTGDTEIRQKYWTISVKGSNESRAYWIDPKYKHLKPRLNDQESGEH
jgi:hypothetical protein